MLQLQNWPRRASASYVNLPKPVPYLPTRSRPQRTGWTRRAELTTLIVGRANTTTCKHNRRNRDRLDNVPLTSSD